MAERSGKRKMSKREGQDESLRLRDEELCVAAAFLEIPCLYGVTDRFFRRGAGSLEGFWKRKSGFSSSRAAL